MGHTRLRPIILTSLTIVVGLLTISTMLTPVLIPTLYVMLEERFPRRLPAMEGAPALQGDMA